MSSKTTRPEPKILQRKKEQHLLIKDATLRRSRETLVVHLQQLKHFILPNNHSTDVHDDGLLKISEQPVIMSFILQLIPWNFQLSNCANAWLDHLEALFWDQKQP